MKKTLLIAVSQFAEGGEGKLIEDAADISMCIGHTVGISISAHGVLSSLHFLDIVLL